jgi:transcriptional regulator with XRE-family HTH domain
MTPEEAFGRTLRAARRERRLTQERLAFASGYHPVYVSQLERGEKSPSLGAIFRLCRALDLPPSELLRRSERLVTVLPERERD